MTDLKKYFNLSKPLIKAQYAFVLILIIWIVLGDCMRRIEFSENDLEYYQNMIDSLESVSEVTVSEESSRYFNFDPNRVDDSIFSCFGIPERIQIIWRNYLKRGGRFYKKSDLLTIYGLDSVVYNRVYPYLDIFAEKSKIDLNTATIDDLNFLNKVPVNIRRRILTYRNLLGGYYSNDQLKEVYGFDKYWKKDYVSIFQCKCNSIRKIDLNHSSYKEMVKHPYISAELAKKILSNRPFDDFDEFCSRCSKVDSLIYRLKYYVELKK